MTQLSTLNQNSPSWVGKLEYNRTIGTRSFFEVRAGEFGYNFGMTNNGNDPRIEDTINLQVVDLIVAGDELYLRSLKKLQAFRWK